MRAPLVGIASGSVAGRLVHIGIMRRCAAQRGRLTAVHHRSPSPPGALGERLKPDVARYKGGGCHDPTGNAGRTESLVQIEQAPITRHAVFDCG